MTITQVNHLAEHVIRENRFELAVGFLRSPDTRKEQAVWFTYKLLRTCRAEQTGLVSYLVHEFVPNGTAPGLVELLQRHEYRMYRRFGIRRGIDQCLRRYLSLSREGRGLLRSLGSGGLLDP